MLFLDVRLSRRKHGYSFKYRHHCDRHRITFTKVQIQTTTKNKQKSPTTI